MKKKISTIIFDLDGVITDSFADVADAVNGALEVLGVEPRSYEYIRKHFNNGDRNLAEKALGNDNAHLVDQVLELYIEIYEKNGCKKTKLFPGVREVLEYYKDRNVALLTNKIERISRQHLEILGVDHYFKLIMGAESTPKLKPDPAGINLIINKMGAKKEETVMVGDSLADMAAGKAAGVITCALTSGYTDGDLLKESSPDYLFDSIEPLITVSDR